VDIVDKRKLSVDIHFFDNKTLETTIYQVLESEHSQKTLDTNDSINNIDNHIEGENYGDEGYYGHGEHGIQGGTRVEQGIYRGDEVDSERNNGEGVRVGVEGVPAWSSKRDGNSPSTSIRRVGTFESKNESNNTSDTKTPFTTGDGAISATERNRRLW
jgi:hypothetical protein